MGGAPKSNRSKLRTQLSQTKIYSRKWKRNSGIFVMLFLAGVFSLRLWKASMMISYAGKLYAVWDNGDAAQNPGSKSVQAAAAQQSHCEWEVNDPLLYRLHHPNEHSEAGYWYQVMESFIGRRSEFQKFFHGMYGEDVYLQEMDYTWRSRLTPMTRLLVAAGLTRSGVRSVHFVDGLHSTFSYPSLDQEMKRSERVGGGVRGLTRDKLSSPPMGQTGVFRLDGHAQRSAFVVASAEQKQQQQLLGDANREGISVPALQDNKNSRSKSEQDGGGGSGQRGWGAGDADVVAGEIGGREGTKAAGECVKFIADVGSWGQTDRDLWFPEDGDARDLLFALDNFCPISWLRKEEAGADGGEEDVADNRAWADGGGGRSGGQGRRNSRGLMSNRVNAEKRKVIIYQRDRDRKLLKSRELADELHDRMSHLGWSVEEIVHDDRRPPCGLIDQLAGADVLLTPYGFQSILSLFLRPGSILFEIYPHKYFAEEYGPVASKFGVRYKYSESPSLLPLTGFSQPTTEACMRWALCRWYVRRSDVEMSDDGLENLISLMLDDGSMRWSL